ncbi:pancreatic secretory granule membrane major glycoprotein GP2-like [Saccostrea cucullata]|uniref:pancreatic secretory granule membrane major glycoprotein GP2-like n=1 Tax=Saccostrea cuccullata TaxID=36930 RepID=UPI002ED6A239
MSLDNIIYTNKLIYALHDPNHHFIVREYRFQINVDCYLPRSEGNSGHFNHGHDVTSSIHVNGSGHHQVHLQFYTDSSFTQIKPLYGSPVGDTVYVKATTNVRDYNVKMKLSDCFTTPTYSSDPSLRYFIISNGCVIDPNARILSQTIHETRFYFQDFEYSMNHDSLYIHCNATFCKSNDYSAKCEQRCHHLFKRIGGGNVINDGPFDSTEVNQAIRMKNGNSNSSSESSSSVAVSVISVIAGLLLVVMITALMLSLRKRRQLTQQQNL